MKYIYVRLELDDSLQAQIVTCAFIKPHRHSLFRSVIQYEIVYSYDDNLSYEMNEVYVLVNTYTSFHDSVRVAAKRAR